MSHYLKQEVIFTLICCSLFCCISKAVAQMANGSAQVSPEVNSSSNLYVTDSVRSMTYTDTAVDSRVTGTAVPMRTRASFLAHSEKANWPAHLNKSRSMHVEGGMISRLPGSRSGVPSGALQSLETSKSLKTSISLAQTNEPYASLLSGAKGSLSITLPSTEMRQGSGLRQESSNIYGFPDSTRGAAFPSPPDPGTQSPLDWTPGLDFSFGDFSQKEFLSPSLSAGLPRRSEGETSRHSNVLGKNATQPGRLATGIQSVSPQPENDTDLLKEPSIQSPLDELLVPPQ